MKFGGWAAVTVRLIEAVLERVPDVPVTMTVTFPVVALLLAVRVSVLVEVAGLVVNVAVTPLGKPEAASVTFPAKPFCEVMVIVLVVVAPCATLNVLGDAEREKLGG